MWPRSKTVLGVPGKNGTPRVGDAIGLPLPLPGKDVDRDSPSSSSSAPSVVSNIEASSDWDAALAGIFSRRWESSLLGEEEGERGRFSATNGED